MDRVGRSVEIVVPQQNISIIKRTPADNRVLECALEAGAKFIVTGDRKDLLSLGSFRGTLIISVAEFLSVLKR